MRKNNVAVDAPAAPALNPDMVARIKKEDMKQAVAERFTNKAAAPGTTAKMRQRSPYWQPADDQC